MYMTQMTSLTISIATQHSIFIVLKSIIQDVPVALFLCINFFAWLIQKSSFKKYIDFIFYSGFGAFLLYVL